MTVGLFGTDGLGVNDILTAHHYLGPISRGVAYRDEYGVMVFANPSSRRLPQQRWVELVRWCIVSDTPNAGSRQWRNVTRWLRANYPHVTTVVSYSDPSAGHTGALYRACNWLWAPTWHRLREPPSGNGYWTAGKRQAVKDRWVFCLAPDAERVSLLSVRDASIVARMPWASFQERRGGDYRRFAAGAAASVFASVLGLCDVLRPLPSVDEVLTVGARAVEFVERPVAAAAYAQEAVVVPVLLAEVSQVLAVQQLIRPAIGTRQARHAGQSMPNQARALWQHPVAAVLGRAA